MLEAHNSFKEMANPLTKRKSLGLASRQAMDQLPSCVQNDRTDACYAEDSRNDLYEQHKHTFLPHPFHSLDRLAGIPPFTSASGRHVPFIDIEKMSANSLTFRLSEADSRGGSANAKNRPNIHLRDF